MQAECCIYLGILQDSLVDHEPCTAEIFLSWLEHELDPAFERIAQGAQELCSTQQNGHMPVMPACMHDTRVHRTIVYLVQFLDGKGIHVGPQQESPAGHGPLEQAYDTGPGDAGLHLDPEASEIFCDDG